MKAIRLAALCVAVLLVGLIGAASIDAQAPATQKPAAATGGSEPPTEAPADWGPMSINLEDVPYPHPVKYLSFALEGQDVRMAHMDVAPVGTPNGKSVILLHGMNFFGEAWTETIEILRKEGYRVIAIDQIGYGRRRNRFCTTRSARTR